MPNINLAGSGEALDASLNTVISAFYIVRREGAIMKSLATNLRLRPHEGTTKYINTYSSLTAYALSDGVDMQQAQTLADAQATYVPAEVGVQVIIADTTLRRVADPELLKSIGKLLSEAYNRKEDSDGCTQIDSFSGNALGAAGTLLAPGHILAGRQSLRVGNIAVTSAAEPAPEPYFAGFHPCGLTSLLGRLVPLGVTATGGTAYGTLDGGTTNPGRTVGPGSNPLGQEILRRGPKALGTVFGIPIYEDANFTVDSSNDSKGGIWSKEGLLHVLEMEPKEEKERDASWRAWELNFVGSYIWGLHRAASYGIEIQVDASLPTT